MSMELQTNTPPLAVKRSHLIEALLALGLGEDWTVEVHMYADHIDVHAVCVRCWPNMDGPGLCGTFPDVYEHAADVTCPVCTDLIDAPCPTCQPDVWAVWVELRDARPWATPIDPTDQMT